MPSDKAPGFDPEGFATRAERAAVAKGFRVEQFGEVGRWPLLAFSTTAPEPRPRIYLSAGIHGDEPAPPLALAELVEAGIFNGGAEWLICPMLNPSGLEKGTRENRAGIDLNRDYRNTRSPEVLAHIHWLRRQPAFDLTVCLHEDYESVGFYLYEQNPDGRTSLAPALLAAASVHCPVDMSPVIDGREARGGLIHPQGDLFERELWPEAIYLRANHTRLAYTVETPSSLPLERRVATLKAVVMAAIRGMIQSQDGPVREGS
jgi:hypothetical protein